MGEVYLARDTQLGRKVALKVVRQERLGNQEALERFLFEARATAQFNHPHLITIYGVGEHAGCPYVALEYLEGQNLHERIQSDPPSLTETLRIGLAIAEGLQEAHAHQILHRDLKPDNILIPATAAARRRLRARGGHPRRGHQAPGRHHGHRALAGRRPPRPLEGPLSG